MKAEIETRPKTEEEQNREAVKNACKEMLRSLSPEERRSVVLEALQEKERKTNEAAKTLLEMLHRYMEPEDVAEVLDSAIKIKIQDGYLSLEVQE